MNQDTLPSETAISLFENKVINLDPYTVSRLITFGASETTLYIFYCLTAKRQTVALQRNIVNVKANDTYCMKGLGWGRDRFYAAKKTLLQNQLIENVTRKDEKGAITGHYIKINYLEKNDTERSSNVQSTRNPESGFYHTVGFQDTNTSNNNINTSNNNIAQIPTISFDGSAPSSPPSSEIPPSSKNSLTPLTDLERWEMAKANNVPLWVIQDTEKNFWEYVEDPKNRKKYKTSYKTIDKWVRMGIAKGQISHCHETEAMKLESDHPDKVREWEELKKLAKEQGII